MAVERSDEVKRGGRDAMAAEIWDWSGGDGLLDFFFRRRTWVEILVVE